MAKGCSIILLLGCLVGIPVNKLSADQDQKVHSRSHAARNLPDVDVTDPEEWQLQQEFNYFSNSGFSNTQLDYGLDTDWNVGLVLLNTQLFATHSSNYAFQPDALLSLERHWPLWQGQLILGGQAGAAVVGSQQYAFAGLSYLNYEYQLADSDLEVDLGAYLANAAVAGVDSAGIHASLQLPVVDKLLLNVDYWSGYNQIGSETLKLLYPLVDEWQIGLGVQRPNINNQADEWIGLLGFYWN